MQCLLHAWSTTIQNKKVKPGLLILLLTLLPDFYDTVNFFLKIFKIGVGSAYEQIPI